MRYHTLVSIHYASRQQEALQASTHQQFMCWLIGSQHFITHSHSTFTTVSSCLVHIGRHISTQYVQLSIVITCTYILTYYKIPTLVTLVALLCMGLILHTIYIHHACNAWAAWACMGMHACEYCMHVMHGCMGLHACMSQEMHAVTLYGVTAVTLYNVTKADCSSHAD